MPPARSTKRGVDARAGLAHLLEVAVRAAVHVVADDDLLTRPDQLGDGRGRRRAAGEGEAVGPALERRHRPFQALAGRVLRAGVLIAAAGPADRVLAEGRGLVDGRRDGPGQLVRLGAGMDRQRVERGLGRAVIGGHAGMVARTQRDTFVAHVSAPVTHPKDPQMATTAPSSSTATVPISLRDRLRAWTEIMQTANPPAHAAARHARQVARHHPCRGLPDDHLVGLIGALLAVDAARMTAARPSTGLFGWPSSAWFWPTRPTT